jgi:glycerol-3-phosphate acyltransferase PlsY
MIFEWILFALGAYLLGSLSFGKYLAYGVAQVDITRQGSGNIGATNVSRELGLKWGLLTLLLDTLKGFLPTWFYLCRHAEGFPHYDLALISIGCSALVGHQYSLFHRFSGGKGVATGLGIYLAISPISCIPTIFLFLLVVHIWHFISLGSMIAAIAMPCFILYFEHSTALTLGGVFAATLIIIRHRENIKRLWYKEEKKWRGPTRL